uniref:DC1 domain-containing protein n=1 Tax=Oryza brachyantha TaxID=4533 RepID=J3MRM0_ORYBR
MDAADLPDEVPHPARPGLMLRLVHHHAGDAPVNFRCDGCREPGEGTRCASANLVLHTHCALATPTLQHPLVRGTLQLRRHVASDGDLFCQACYGDVLGLHKTSKGEYPDLHPCCAKLPVSITVRGGLTFELREEVSRRCSSCRAMEGYWSPWCYRSTNEPRVYLHVKCIKEIMPVLFGGGGGGGVGEVLLVLMRVVAGLLLGDPTAPLLAVNLIFPSNW